MGTYVPPADKALGETVTAADWNALKQSIEDFINQGKLGDSNFSSDPNERLDSIKIDFAGGSGTHAAIHEPGGNDEVGDIDILDTGILLSVHAARHASGADDALPDDSVSSSMLQDDAFSDEVLNFRRNAVQPTAANLNKTFVGQTPAGARSPSVTAQDHRGNGVVIGDFAYWAVYDTDLCVKVDYSVDPPTASQVGSGSWNANEHPHDMVRVGTDIYVIGEGEGAEPPRIRKIDTASSDAVTSVQQMNSGVTAFSGSDPDESDHLCRGMTINDDRTAVYVVAKSGATQFDYICKVTISPSVSYDYTSQGDAGATHPMDGFDCGPPIYIKRGTTERIIMVGTSGTTTRIFRLDETDGSQVDQLDLATIAPLRTLCVYDGQYLLCLENDLTGIDIVDVWATTMRVVGTISTFDGQGTLTPETAEPAGYGAFFDGRFAWFGCRDNGQTNQDGFLLRVPVPGYTPATYVNIGRTAATDDSRVNAMASDGKYLYLVLERLVPNTGFKRYDQYWYS